MLDVDLSLIIAVEEMEDLFADPAIEVEVVEDDALVRLVLLEGVAVPYKADSSWAVVHPECSGQARFPSAGFSGEDEGGLGNPAGLNGDGLWVARKIELEGLSFCSKPCDVLPNAVEVEEVILAVSGTKLAFGAISVSCQRKVNVASLFSRQILRLKGAMIFFSAIP